MEWFQNYQITPAVQSGLKRANQRIVQLTKSFGSNSSIYKQNVGKFFKGPYSKYLSTSKSGNVKFNVRAVNQAIRTGSVTRSEINRFLSEAAGIMIQEDGSIKEVKGGGIDTKSEIIRRTEKKLEKWGEDPSDYSKKQLENIAETLAEFSENFQTAYTEFIARYGEETARTDETIQQLYGDYRQHKLTYRDLQNIKDKMDSYFKQTANEATQFEEDNSNEL